MVNPVMNYDSWKLAANIDSKSQILEERCSDIEAFVDGKFTQVVGQSNRATEHQWDVEPVLADFSQDGDITLEVNLRLKRVPVTGNATDLQELGRRLIQLGEALNQAAQPQQTTHGLRLSSSVTDRGVGPMANLG